MKRKSSKKKSNKKETEENSRYVTGFVVDENSRRNHDLYINWPEFIKFCNYAVEYYHSSIAKLEYVSPGFKSWVQQIVNKWNTKKALKDAVVKMLKSDFLNGRKKGVATDRRFVASFYWLFHKEENFVKVLNGYYDNPEDVKTAEEQRREAEEQRRLKAEEQRRKAAEIERQMREEQRRKREEMYANAAKGEELKRIWAEIQLPPLKETNQPA